MTQLENWLAGGDLRSDGASNEVAGFVIQNPHVLADLVAALDSENDVIRGRAADALEKVARELPQVVEPHLDRLMHIAYADPIPMVRWHLAMLLGHLSIVEQRRGKIQEALSTLLEDRSVFVVSWVIASLSVIASQDPQSAEQITKLIAPFQRSQSAALRTRARTALQALTDPAVDLPEGWVKSNHVRARLNRLT